MPAQEYVIPLFSGGINPSEAPDKLNDSEALQAMNVRLDDFGNLASAFPSSLQASGLKDASNNTNAHSLFIAPSLGCMAGAGKDVYSGLAVGSLADTLVGQNPAQGKISAASTSDKIFFELNAVPYFVGGRVTMPLLLDWAPPGSSITTTNGPFTVTTSGTATYNAFSPHWSNANGIIGSGTATAQITAVSRPITDYLRGLNPAGAISTSSHLQGIQFSVPVAVTASATSGFVTLNALLEINGVVVGATRSQTFNVNSGATTITFGSGTADGWDAGLTSAQVNNSTFGVRIQAVSSTGVSTPVNVMIGAGQFTFYQSSGTGITAGTGAAGVLTGNYIWYVTFVGEDGEESDLSPATSPVALTNQQGALSTIPLGDARTVSRNVYRNGGLLTSPYLVGSISDNVSTSYSDNQTDLAALTEGVIAAGAVAGTNPNTRLGGELGRYPCFHLQRLFWCNGNRIFWSDVTGGPFSYPSVNELPIGDGQQLIGLVSKWNCLVMIKTDSIYILSGTDESNFTVTRTESQVGSNMPFTISSIANGIAFGNNSGNYIFNGAVSVKFAPKLDLLFRGQSRNGIPAIETTNAAVYVNHCGVATADSYFYACAASGGASNTLLFIINLLTGAIVTRSIAVLGLAVDATTNFVYAGLANGQIVKLEDYTVSSDSQGPLAFTYQTKYTDCNSRGSNLEILGFEFWGNTGGAAVTPTISYDGGNKSEVLASFSSTTNQRVQRSFSSSNSRKAQTVSIRLDAPISTGAGPIELSHIKVWYNVLPGRARTGQ
jgi:hypothetical protein